VSAREEVEACDLAIVEALNRRIELGATWVDVPALVEANDGPVSEAALRELFSVVLALTRREAARARVAWHSDANRATV
jgi:hypothetical protein